MYEILPAATLNGLPVAANAPMLVMWDAARPPYSICCMPMKTPVDGFRLATPGAFWRPCSAIKTIKKRSKFIAYRLSNHPVVSASMTMPLFDYLGLILGAGQCRLMDPGDCAV